MSTRPNFLFLITDQHRADYLGCYGHPVLRTPHIDSIAARGTQFRKFYVASPVCMPNRASLMTGRMPAVHGVRSNGIPLSQDCVTFVELLRDAGYDTALIGKSHLQNFTGHPALSKPAPTPAGYRQPSPALRMATLESAALLGQQGVLGEIAPGHQADLIVLRQNPLENIAHTKSIDSVWLNGLQAAGPL